MTEPLKCPVCGHGLEVVRLKRARREGTVVRRGTKRMAAKEGISPEAIAVATMTLTPEPEQP